MQPGEWRGVWFFDTVACGDRWLHGVHLHDVAGQGQQALEIAQALCAVMRGGFGSFFQCGGGMFLGELQEAPV